MILIYWAKTSWKQDTLLECSKEFRLEVKERIAKYVFILAQNAGQNHNLMVANKLFDNMAQSKYLGTTAVSKKLDSQKN
jgi:hypothetical protein